MTTPPPPPNPAEASFLSSRLRIAAIFIGLLSSISLLFNVSFVLLALLSPSALGRIGSSVTSTSANIRCIAAGAVIAILFTQRKHWRILLGGTALKPLRISAIAYAVGYLLLSILAEIRSNLFAPPIQPASWLVTTRLCVSAIILLSVITLNWCSVALFQTLANRRTIPGLNPPTITMTKIAAALSTLSAATRFALTHVPTNLIDSPTLAITITISDLVIWGAGIIIWLQITWNLSNATANLTED